MTAQRETHPARRTPRATVAVRGAALLGAPLLAVLATAVPASADVPLGWDPAQEAVPGSHVLWIVLGIIGGILLIAAAVYLPAVARGESIRPGSARPDYEWLGGPRRAHQELAAPDNEESQAGGASGRW
ncbi:hypothetical protein RDV89_02380 [Nocardioides zeae]|uniref:Secreted protein n=1 Tax=Nocardioides imazamoxiresistens TaxID=3231893 RepID=A0ABU3PRS6_9ACTN|nr:hypothetical protein [Nocardioides zeae]MDT9591898.1 hypothetical protein [Nocardioides zeae]